METLIAVAGSIGLAVLIALGLFNFLIIAMLFRYSIASAERAPRYLLSAGQALKCTFSWGR